MLDDSPRLLGDLLENTARRFPDKEAILYGETHLTWMEFNHQVDNLASAFLTLGIARGDRIGIISTTRPEYLCVYLAAARIGAVLVGFNILFTPSEVTQLANLTRPKVMIVLDQVKDKPIAEPLMALFKNLL